MIHYDLETMNREDYKLQLEANCSAFTPNLDNAILDAYDALRQTWLDGKAYKLQLRLDGVSSQEIRKLSKSKFSLYDFEMEIARLVKIKEYAAKKQIREKELKDWSRGFDKYGRYTN